MRFRRPTGKQGNLPLGPFDPSDQEVETAPSIGQPLTAPAAHALAADINRQRARGIDVIALRQTEKQRQSANAHEPQITFPTHVRDFIERHARPKTRRWRAQARMLGYAYASEGNTEPVLIEGSLADRWRVRQITEINGDDIYAVVDEAQHRGIPGLEQRCKGPSEARGRKMADVLGILFKWLHQHRRIKLNPTIGVHRPEPPKARARILNTKPDVRGGDELRWFWAACDVLDHPFGNLFKMLLLTGARREELARMEWTELSDDMSVLRLPGSRTKNHRPHNLPIAPLARAILAGVPRTGERYVFSTDGIRPIAGFSKIKRRLDDLMLQQAIGERGAKAVIAPFVLHDLRRSTASGCAAIGIQPHIIEAILNHVSGSAKAGVAGTYNTEAYEPEKAAALSRWGAHVEGIVSGSGGARIVALRR